MTTFSLPGYVKNVKYLDMPLSTFKSERPKYDNYPYFQREKVWTSSMKRHLIDTIRRRWPIDTIFLIERDHRYLVVHGQQRLSTIIEYFADGFATSWFKDEPCLERLESKRYSQLSASDQEAFNDYTVRLGVLENMSDAELGVFFRRLQLQQSLILPEKLWTYDSEAKKIAKGLEEHAFWKKIYMGNQSRKRLYLGGLYVLLIELAQGAPFNVTSPQLRTLASGLYDSQIQSGLSETIGRRLDDAYHLFYQTSLPSLKEVIPVYQTMFWLENADCNPKKSQQGCLTPWYTRVRDDSSQALHSIDATDFIAKMASSKYQTLFWAQESSRLLQTDGLCFVDRRRAFSTADKQRAWERQKGLCVFCDQPLDRSGEGHHVVKRSDGGPTTLDNCQIAHDCCHTRFHEKWGVDIEIVPVEGENSDQ
jgi:Protein of unknown function DUF262/HNH endonuclease